MTCSAANPKRQKCVGNAGKCGRTGGADGRTNRWVGRGFHCCWRGIMFPRPFDKRGCHFPFDWRTSLLSSRDSFIPAARTCRLCRTDRIQVVTMSHIIPLYLELASEIPTPASFLCPVENHHNITKHAEPIPSRLRYGAAMLLF